MYYDEFTQPSKSAVPPPNPFASKAPVNQKENVKPTTTPTPAKAVDEPKEPVGGQPTSLTLAMRQAGAEAAQLAKGGKKKVETLVGVGQAEPEPAKKAVDTKSKEKAEVEDVTKSLDELSVTSTPQTPHKIDSVAALQSPNSTSWKQPIPFNPTATPKSAPHSIDSAASLQSPTSTAWKSADTKPPVMTHRGSEVSVVSKECIKKIEDEQAIAEESEEDDDSEDDEESEEGGEDEENEEDEDEDDEDDEDDEESEEEEESKKV